MTGWIILGLDPQGAAFAVVHRPSCVPRGAELIGLKTPDWVLWPCGGRFDTIHLSRSPLRSVVEMTFVARRTTAWIVLGTLALATVVATIAGRYTGGVDRSVERVRQAGVLRVGYSVEAPFAVVGPDGSVGGQSAECAAEIARALGVRIEWVQTELDRQIPDLLAGRFDVVGAGLFMSPERAKQVRFSVATLRVRPAWLTRRGSAAPTTQALRSGWRLAVVRGSAAERHLAALGLSEQLNRVPDARTGAAGIAQGLYDALALPWPVGRSFAAGRADELMVWPADDGRPDLEVGLAFRPEDLGLAGRANAALATWMQSPAYVELLKQNGLSADDLPRSSHASAP